MSLKLKIKEQRRESEVKINKAIGIKDKTTGTVCSYLT